MWNAVLLDMLCGIVGRKSIVNKEAYAVGFIVSFIPQKMRCTGHMGLTFPWNRSCGPSRTAIALEMILDNEDN